MLKSVVLPQGLKKIKNKAFDKCKGITDLKLPEGMEFCYLNSINIEELVLPEGLLFLIMKLLKIVHH